MKSENGTSPKLMIRIQIGLTTLLVGVVIVVACLIHFPWQYLSRISIEKLVLTVNSEILKGVHTKILGQVERAELVESIMQDNFESGLVDIADPAKRKTFCFKMAELNPTFTWISIGFPNGDFYGVRRDETGKMYIEDSRWDPSTKQATRRIETYQVQPGRMVLTDVSYRTNDYFSPQRDWYQQASTAPSHIWTSVYIFSVTKKPGLNSAIAVHTRGQLAAVVSVAFELEDISRYLSEISIGKTGKAFIMNKKGELIASQNIKDIQAREDDPGSNLRTLADSTAPHLVMVRSLLEENRVRLMDISTGLHKPACDPATGQDYLVSLMPLAGMDWYLAIVIPSADFLAEINTNSLYLLMILGIAILFTAVFVVMLTRTAVLKPIMRITDQLVYIRDFKLESIHPVRSRITEIHALSEGLVQMTTGLLSFQKYIPTELVREMMSQGIQAELGGEERELTILFSDIAQFTKHFERHGNGLIPQLGEYLSALSDVIAAEHGSIDKYIGDSIMSFWGAPVRNTDHAFGACSAAILMQRALARLRTEWNIQGKPEFQTRIGINTGKVVVGNIGSTRRLNYTVIGDPVNLASRLEGLNKSFGTNILAGDSTYARVRDRIVARKVACVAVYGKSEPEDIHELIAFAGEEAASIAQPWIRMYEKAFQHFLAREWKEAIDGFRQVSVLKGSKDGPSGVFTQFAIQYTMDPPAAGWNGVVRMKSK